MLERPFGSALYVIVADPTIAHHLEAIFSQLHQAGFTAHLHKPHGRLLYFDYQDLRFFLQLEEPSPDDSNTTRRIKASPVKLGTPLLPKKNQFLTFSLDGYNDSSFQGNVQHLLGFAKRIKPANPEGIHIGLDCLKQVGQFITIFSQDQLLVYTVTAVYTTVEDRTPVLEVDCILNRQ